MGGFGFTWLPLDDISVGLRASDGRYIRVERGFFERLRVRADATKAKAAWTDNDQHAFDSLGEAGFIVPDTSIHKLTLPPDIVLPPRLLLFGGLFCALVALSATTWHKAWPLPHDPSENLWAIPFFAAISILHEFGHYAAARPYFRPSIGLGLLNRVFPALMTNTNDAWACPRGVRIWISIAGPLVELTVGLGIALVYLYAFPDTHILATLLFVILLRIIFVLNPLLEGDGYWLLVDLFGTFNLRTLGWNDLRQGRMSRQAWFVLASLVYTLFALAVAILFISSRLGALG